MTNNTYNVLNGFRRPEDSTSGIPLDNQLYIYGTIDLGGSLISSTKFINVLNSNDVTWYDSLSTDINISGKARIFGGTGGFTLNLAAPQPGAFADILLGSIISGSVDVKLPAGITFDGTNNTATFNTSGEYLKMGYGTTTQWKIFDTSGVVFSIT